MPVVWFGLLINLPGRLQTQQEQDHPHVSITCLLILYNFVLNLYPYPLDGIVTALEQSSRVLVKM